MRSKPTTLLAGLAATSLALTACGGVSTSTSGGDDEGSYPSGTVEMYVGADPGGSSDLISRAVSKGLSDELGASFPVINKPGANGALAAAELASAEPDGSTIANQNASLFAITPLAVSEDEVTSIDDFEVVQGVSRDDYVLVAKAGGDYTTLKDVENATETLKYGTSGVGTGSQLSTALLLGDAGVDGTPVPYDGGAPALAAVLGGGVDLASLQIGEAIENIESGKLVPLTVFGAERVEYLPDVPTAQEQGLDVEVTQYRFLTVPKDTPDDVQQTLAEGLQATFETEEYQEFNEQNSLTPMEIPGDEVVAQLEEDQQRYADLVEEYDINLAE
jgi:tripartite-type tricarboxylate transporter receptor subunit TctC